ncbi:hypothetical protein GCM10008995_10970 [Halobellus salinus]|uniref:Putative sensor domain-containing protein n=1 Tax=Halobellus salinus TaxID=931585 RepID=A0A830E900_9EURY|nr:sensor domain-containing protein [Halobellus salinus]GGJ02989.1 hypothetical protein GCM10008995_10970 [Halobellus salinus]SMP21885.1 Putative sensor [Halobellus salinus]
MSTVDPFASTKSLRGVGRQFLGAPLRARTYRHLLYLVLAFPLGVVYFVGFVTGTAAGLGLLVTWVGLPILLLTLVAAAAAAGIEARLATRLVGVDAAVPVFLREFDVNDGLAVPGDGFVDAVRRLVTTPSTWTAVVLLVYKFVFGTAAFVAVTTVGSVSAALLAAPFVYDDPAGVVSSAAAAGQYRVGSWTVGSLPEALAVAAGGVVVLVVGLNLLNGLARFHARSVAGILRVGTGD